MSHCLELAHVDRLEMYMSSNTHNYGRNTCAHTHTHTHTEIPLCSVGQATAVFGASGRAANEPNGTLDNSHLLTLSSCSQQPGLRKPSQTNTQRQGKHLGKTLQTHKHIHAHHIPENHPLSMISAVTKSPRVMTLSATRTESFDRSKSHK